MDCLTDTQNVSPVKVEVADDVPASVKAVMEPRRLRYEKRAIMWMSGFSSTRRIQIDIPTKPMLARYSLMSK